ncbi:MAG TPA: anti-sigma factor [Vicinamibacterales bacterium]|nr:anti-sigma factor [Vicinamibacterales bacterium]
MLPQTAGLEQRLVDLEAQISRLTATLLHSHDADDDREPMERRLAELTDQVAVILKQWTATGERYAQAVGELETRLTGWNEIETRLQRDAAGRFQGLERTIGREWASLRLLHEEPARQLREQAENLTEICVNTAGSAQTGIERAEARLAALEHDLHRKIDHLSRDLHEVLAELRHHGGPPSRTPASAWPLDEVTRLHHELREGAAADDPRPGVLEGRLVEGSARRSGPPAASPFLESTGETQVTTRADQPEAERDHDIGQRAPADRFRSTWYAAAVAALVIAMSVVGGLGWSFYRRANLAVERASEAQQRAERIAAAANERIEATRQDAAAQVTKARDAASKAQVTSDVLAASDLVRFNLVGSDPAVRTLAQLLWSRSRGMVFSASRMPQPPQGAIYQVWLLTAAAPISLGTIAPDASGRVTLATDTPPDAPRPIVGVRVTLEPAPGRAEPSGPVVLARPQ